MQIGLQLRVFVVVYLTNQNSHELYAFSVENGW